VARKPILRVTEGPAKGTEYAIQDGFLIGRDPDCQINTRDQTTSRKHAQISREKDGYRLVDLESANGMLINKRKLRSHYIKHNDEITMGDTTFIVEFIVDPVVRRRNMRIALVVIFMALAGVGYYAYSIWLENFLANQIIARNLDAEYISQPFGFTLRYPASCKVDEYPFQVRPWVRANEGITGEGPWGTIYPQVGNGLATDEIALDTYMRGYFVEMIRPEKYEFYRFQVDAYDGLQSWADLSDYGITDKTLPQATRLEVKLPEVKYGEHPQYGKYEEAESVYSAGADLTFYARQRVYVVGKRRFVVTAITNYAIIGRVQQLFESFFANGFDIDVAAATQAPKMSDDDLFQLGEKLYTEAERMNEDSGVLTNRQYRAFLRYQAALKHFKEMSRPTTDFDKALKSMRSLRLGLQDRLKQFRDEVRDQMNRSRFDQAQEGIDKVRELLNTADEPYKPAYQEEWIVWCDAATESLQEARNVHKATQYLKAK
jgi:hypothetical protein